MGLINRDKGGSEQIVDIPAVLSGVVATGTTTVLTVLPWPGTLQAAGAAYFGLSGSPSHSLWVYRWAGASGSQAFTSIQIAASLGVVTYGSSGFQGFSIYAGVTYPLLAGDAIALYALGSNAAVSTATIMLCVQASQDSKTHFGYTP
jgi:hypothetical protein